jgi:hypothetical protein
MLLLKCLINQGLQLLLLRQQLQEIEQKRDVVVPAAYVLITPIGPLVLFSGDGRLQPSTS